MSARIPAPVATPSPAVAPLAARRRSHLRWWALPAAGWLCPSAWPLVWAQAQPAPATDRTETTRWLERMRQAAVERSFAGTLVHTAADVVSSSRVVRLGTGMRVWERLEALDGRQSSSWRHNEWVHTIWPETRTVTVERRSPVDDALGLPVPDVRLQAHYDTRMLGQERLAGRDAVVLLLKPLDEWRFAQRLWADKASGLLLRADVLGPQAQVLQSAAFSHIELDVRPTRDQMLNPARRLEGYRTVQLPTETTSLEHEGWQAGVERIPPGFRLLGCVQRAMGQTDAHLAASPKPARALQAVFSDGLARVSLFAEVLDAARPRQSLITHMGATHTLMRAREPGWWITVMGDVPVPTLKAFYASLQRRA